jgi:hypothetical protein
LAYIAPHGAVQRHLALCIKATSIDKQAHNLAQFYSLPVSIGAIAIGPFDIGLVGENRQSKTNQHKTGEKHMSHVKSLPETLPFVTYSLTKWQLQVNPQP